MYLQWAEKNPVLSRIVAVVGPTVVAFFFERLITDSTSPEKIWEGAAKPLFASFVIGCLVGILIDVALTCEGMRRIAIDMARTNEGMRRIAKEIDHDILEKILISLNSERPYRIDLFKKLVSLWDSLHSFKPEVTPALEIYLDICIRAKIRNISVMEAASHVEPNIQVEMSRALFRKVLSSKLAFFDTQASRWSDEFNAFMDEVNSFNGQKKQYFLVNDKTFSLLPGPTGVEDALSQDIEKRKRVGFTVYAVNIAPLQSGPAFKFLQNKRFEVYDDALLIIEAQENYNEIESLNVKVGSYSEKDIFRQIENMTSDNKKQI